MPEQHQVDLTIGKKKSLEKNSNKILLDRADVNRLANLRQTNKISFLAYN
jgi:hypothetical protein